MPGRLILRADAGPQIGTGHVMRCLALARAWQARRGRVELASCRLPDALALLAERQGVVVHRLDARPGSTADARQTERLLRSGPVLAAWLVLDGYHFHAGYQRAIGDTSVRTLLIDDYGSLDGYETDLVLNQNLGAEASWYGARPEARTLLGPRFALLRPEFARVRRAARLVRRRAERLLITLGGADPLNTAEELLPLMRCPSLPPTTVVRVIAGSANRHFPSLRRAVRAAATESPCRIELLRSTPNMSRQMAWADLAIAAAGSTVWELSCVGTPFFSIVLADNQRRIAAQLDTMFPGISWGEAGRLDRDRMADDLARWSADQVSRRERILALQRLVDGHGADRVVRAMIDDRAAERPGRDARRPVDAQGKCRAGRPATAHVRSSMSSVAMS